MKSLPKSVEITVEKINCLLGTSLQWRKALKSSSLGVIVYIKQPNCVYEIYLIYVLKERREKRLMISNQTL